MFPKLLCGEAQNQASTKCDPYVIWWCFGEATAVLVWKKRRKFVNGVMSYTMCPPGRWTQSVAANLCYWLWLVLGKTSAPVRGVSSSLCEWMCVCICTFVWEFAQDCFNSPCSPVNRLGCMAVLAIRQSARSNSGITAGWPWTFEPFML